MKFLIQAAFLLGWTYLTFKTGAYFGSQYQTHQAKRLIRECSKTVFQLKASAKTIETNIMASSETMCDFWKLDCPAGLRLKSGQPEKVTRSHLADDKGAIDVQEAYRLGVGGL